MGGRRRQGNRSERKSKGFFFLVFFLNQGEIRCEAAHFLPAGGGGRRS